MGATLYDSSHADAIVWPEAAEGVKSFFLPMLKLGAKSFVSNVDTKLYLLRVDDLFFPLTVNEKEYESSYLTSNYFPISSRLEKPSKFLLKRGFVGLAGGFFKGIKINQAVLVNNWLISASLLPTLSSSQLKEMTDCLVAHFPHHTLMFRNLLQESLSPFFAQHYGVTRAREVFCYDPKWPLDKKALYHHRRDRRLIDTLGYHVVRGDALRDKIPQILDLYSQIYIKKHTKYSPAYTEKFMHCVFQSPLFDVVGLEKEGQIDGVFVCHKREGRMTVPLFGYHLNRPDTGQLYRMLTLLVLDEAIRDGLFLNDGTGGDVTKSLRGMRQTTEYVTFYGRHLTTLRRSFWLLADYFTTLPTKK